ncbi:hypothetical protein R5R35_001661 [Gryllus longicercus]
MVGTTLACKIGMLEKLSDKTVLLLEGSPEKEWIFENRYSNRVSAINPSTKNLMESIGVWKHITERRFKVVKKMQVWDAISDAMITFTSDEKFSDIAYIVENDLILASVTKQLKHLNNVSIQYGAKVKNCVLPQSGSSEQVSVELEDGTELKCSLLVGADGASSLVRKTMGVQYLSWNYHQMGIVATLRLSEPTDNVVAWQRFLPSGPIALLPLNDELSSLVWSTGTEEAKAILKLSDEEFVDTLNEALWKQYPSDNIVNSATKHFNSVLEFLTLTSNAVRQLQPSIVSVESKSRAAFPLGFGHSTKYVAPGVALIGDAAHRVHPLAGQGVNLGFGDVVALTNQLVDAVSEGNCVSNINYLLRYETLRQRHNVPTILVIDGLQKLYGTTITPLVVLRSLGLQLIHSVPPVKRAILNHASV